MEQMANDSKSAKAHKAKTAGMLKVAEFIGLKPYFTGGFEGGGR
jgi:hypothetical protein